ncbi:MAG: hypothetical protein J6C92_05495 [Bacteroidaceae bacterium]|nr:hypothetical protein [Bacteroidaceae bacterium]
MKKSLLLLLMSVVLFSCDNTVKKNEKEIYIPKDLQEMDLKNPESKWSYDRMECTENFAIFWEKGFGNDLSNPPQLEGNPMAVDLENLKEKLESFYDYFYHTLQFAKKGSKCDKYRMMVMINYSLEGTAYGGDYDGEIGALWVAPNRVQDKKLNCIAHELGHSFQSQITCDGQGEAWGGSGFFEMTSQWMLWHVNPEWVTDENYHWVAFCKDTHKAFLQLTNIYRSPYVLEYWSQKHGLTVIADLFRQGKKGEDPAMTYKQMFNLTQEQFNDEMFDASRRIVNLDFTHAFDVTRKHAGQMTTKLGAPDAEGWRMITPENCPENYGFNAIPLNLPEAGTTVSVDFKGQAGAKGFNAVNTDKAGWRYGFIATDKEGKCTYSEMGKENIGNLSYQVPEGTEQLWLVVMGAPTEYWRTPERWGNEGEDKESAQWPYSIKLNGTTCK